MDVDGVVVVVVVVEVAAVVLTGVGPVIDSATSVAGCCVTHPKATNDAAHMAVKTAIRPPLTETRRLHTSAAECIDRTNQFRAISA